MLEKQDLLSNKTYADLRLGVNVIKFAKGFYNFKLGVVELFEDEMNTRALHSPHGEGGPPLGGG